MTTSTPSRFLSPRQPIAVRCDWFSGRPTMPMRVAALVPIPPRMSPEIAELGVLVAVDDPEVMALVAVLPGAGPEDRFRFYAIEQMDGELAHAVIAAYVELARRVDALERRLAALEAGGGQQPIRLDPRGIV